MNPLKIAAISAHLAIWYAAEDRPAPKVYPFSALQSAMNCAATHLHQHCS